MSARSSRSAAKTTSALPVLKSNAAGIDIAASVIYVAVPEDRSPQPVRSFGTFTRDLHTIAEWLRECGIETVAMESTGVFWIPLFQILEARGFDVCLVNARHVKNVPGHKTDVADSSWLQYLHAVGLLRASFRPNQTVCALRSLLRHRDTLVTYAASHVQHMQKSLTQMNIQLHHVISDLTGKTGLAILDAVLAGETDSVKLAQLRDPRIKASHGDIVKALEGDWKPEHLFTLRQALGAYRHYQQMMAECDQEIERMIQEFDSRTDLEQKPLPPPTRPGKFPRGNDIRCHDIDLRAELYRIFGTDLTQAPGLGITTIHSLFSEIGADLSAFPTAKHFCSWLGLCPENKVSGGKILSVRTRKVRHRAADTLRMAAQGLHHSQSALGEFYRRMRARLGAPAAITATAHKLARIIYHLITTGETYNESAFADAESQYGQRKLRRLSSEAAALGFTLALSREFLRREGDGGWETKISAKEGVTILLKSPIHRSGIRGPFFMTAFLLACLFVPMAHADDLHLKATVGPTGLATLSYNGVDILSNGELSVQKALFISTSGVQSEASVAPAKTTLSADGATIERDYSWGTVSCRYTVADNRLGLTVDVSNTSANTLRGLEIQPLELKFPQAPSGWVKDYAYFGANLGDPTVEYARFGSGTLAVCNEDVTRPLLVGFPGRANLTVRPISICTSNIPGYLSPYLDSRLQRVIPPHGHDTFTISLRFGPPNAGESELAGDIFRKLGAAYPSQPHWADRRAIGTLHLAASEERLHSAGNPRGWFADPAGVDIRSADGKAAFRQRILKYADDSVAILKKMDAQGMITWDIEGEEYPQATTYIGDPRRLKDLAPEMDSVADAYFKRFRDAGMRTGLCIRPQRLIDTYAELQQQEIGAVDDIAGLLFDKIRYANRRWGCSLFYIDSNGDPNVPYDPAIFEILARRLAREKIDALVFPEHRNMRYYGCTAPYTSLGRNVFGTPDSVRIAYPNAFLASYVPDREIGSERAALVHAVRAGDILLFRAWWDDPVNAEVKSIYDEASRDVP